METFIGRIIIFCGNFAPIGWDFCNGQLYPISGNEALFSLIGTTYGGDGQNTFALPDLRGRVPVHPGNGINLGDLNGFETVTLLANNLPAHNHNVTIGVNSANGEESNPQTILAASSNAFGEDVNAYLGGVTVSLAGSSNPINIRNPFLAVNYIIATEGIYPSRP